MAAVAAELAEGAQAQAAPVEQPVVAEP